MTSFEVSIKNAVLPSALANAALLIAAPSLGSIDTFSRALSDLCSVYDLPIPDLTHILQYRATPTSSSKPTGESQGQAQEPQVTMDTCVYAEPETSTSSSTTKTTGEVRDTMDICVYAEPETVNIKQEVAFEEYTATLNLPSEMAVEHEVTTKAGNGSSISGTTLKLLSSWFNDDFSSDETYEPTDSDDAAEVELSWMDFETSQNRSGVGRYSLRSLPTADKSPANPVLGVESPEAFSRSVKRMELITRRKSRHLLRQLNQSKLKDENSSGEEDL